LLLVREVTRSMTKVLQALGVSPNTKSTFVLTHPNEILQALVGLKEVQVVQYERSGRDVYLMIEQVIGAVSCESCGGRAQVKDRPVVHYVDPPVYGVPMHLACKKHRMRCVNVLCPRKSWVLSDYRIAACRGQGLPSHHESRQVGDCPGGHRQDRLGGRKRARL